MKRFCIVMSIVLTLLATNLVHASPQCRECIPGTQNCKSVYQGYEFCNGEEFGCISWGWCNNPGGGYL
jgi:hypothetical protein